jgi:hypothetical protein
LAIKNISRVGAKKKKAAVSKGDGIFEPRPLTADDDHLTSSERKGGPLSAALSRWIDGSSGAKTKREGSM